jgi:predicted peroxiredoxin
VVRQLIPCTHDRHDPERATLPFVVANAAVASGVDATIVCTIDGVNLGVRGGAQGIEAPQMAPLAQLFDAFVSAGGRVWLCSACTKPRGIGEEDLADGVQIVGAATIVQEVANGAAYLPVT